jgi:hypothetical protein
MPIDTTDVSSLVHVSESDVSRQPALAEEQSLLQDQAAMLSLMRPESEETVVDAIRKMLTAHCAEIDANGRWRRARLTGTVNAFQQEIVLRNALLPEHVKLVQQRTALRDRCSTLDHEIARLKGDLVRRHHAAEDEQLDAQVAALRTEEAEAQRRASSIATDDAENADDQAIGREERIRLLETKRSETVAAAAPAVKRADGLKARFVTQTVAGFLLWLGYGSVAATGAVLALMMNGGDSGQLGAVVEAWRSIIDSFGLAQTWLRVIAGAALVAALLALIGGSIASAERLFLKKRKDWNTDERRKREPHVNLSPQSITRRTYTQYIALLPFLFGAGILATILVVTPLPVSPATAANGVAPQENTAVLTSVLPTLGYAFVGIVIAFLATAVFVMYVVRIVEPRQTGDGTTSVLRAGWEFIVPPVVLLIAVAATPFLLNQATSGPRIAGREWVPWAAFMLVSSLCLACGVVYHGVFKDAKTARATIDAIDTQLDRERGIAGDQGQRDDAIANDYEEELRRLQAVRRDLRLARLGVSITGRKDDSSVLVRAWRWVRRRKPASDGGSPHVGVSGDSETYQPIVYDVAGDVLADLARCRSERAFVMLDLEKVEEAIGRCEKFTAFEVMLALRQRIEIVKGDRDASIAEDAERKQRAAINGEVLTLGARSVFASGATVKPFFDGVRADLARHVQQAIDAPAGGHDHE